MDAICSHAHYFLDEGEVDVDDETIECPKHGSTFDLNTGRPRTLPATQPVEVFATKIAGYPTVFAHGMLSMGATGRMLTNWVGDGRLTKYGVRFVAQVWPGDSLTARARVETIRDENGQKLADLSVVTVNQDGKEVVSGYACARLDP